MATAQVVPPAKTTPQITNQRVNGKNWHETRKAFRPTAGLTSYEKRKAKQSHEAEVRKMETEMKEEKEAERQVGLSFHYCVPVI
jgi:rRNA-processing protein CGR1